MSLNCRQRNHTSVVHVSWWILEFKFTSWNVSPCAFHLGVIFFVGRMLFYNDMVLFAVAVVPVSVASAGILNVICLGSSEVWVGTWFLPGRANWCSGLSLLLVPRQYLVSAMWVLLPVAVFILTKLLRHFFFFIIFFTHSSLDKHNWGLREVVQFAFSCEPVPTQVP